MNIPRGALSACLALAVFGCSNQQVYDGLQASKRNECQNHPEPERGRCLDSTNTRYEDYEREREKAGHK
ncbi:MAG: hypothetical protein ABI794_13945 [Betaproteobacteria bacterium]